ncbi:hypothetical protein HELRODRAFT_138083, partial [Helobdella robusta]|uniref:CAP-Gly domain-containing protein n=1 Tax=Helobdella robusta TaxID=6412 RepID=T1EIR4_HELRO
LKIGSRVIVGTKHPHTGTLRFIGTVHFKRGFWCGVELDDETGLHDGLVSGVRYFTCPPKKGLFAPLSKI